jgi:EmrB/QacA subfamily drug resistance transporter
LIYIGEYWKSQEFIDNNFRILSFLLSPGRKEGYVLLSMKKKFRIPRKWSVFFMVAVGVFLSTMDSSMINVALPSIMRSFGTTLPRTEWVVLIYLLTITVSLLFWGRVGDQFGKGVVYLTGMFVFSVGSMACYLSATLAQLIFFRFIQALGAAMMMATGPAIIKMFFPIGQLGLALGLVGIATSIGLMTGPVISGILIHSYSWRAIFLVTVPVSVAVFLAGWFYLRPQVGDRKMKKSALSFDWYGMLLWTGMLTVLVLLSTHYKGVSAQLLVFEGVAFFLLLILFVKTESRHLAPLLPLTLLRDRSFFIAIFCAALSFAVLFVVLILMPFYLDYVLGLPVKQIGFVMMAVPIAVFIVSPLSGYFYDRIGARFLTTAGLSVAALGLLLLCFLSADSSPFTVAWRLAVLGCGQALFLSPNSATVLDNVGHDQAGVSSGMLATARNLGMLVGVSLAGLVFGMVFSHLSGGLDLKEYGPEQVQIFIPSLRITFAFTAVLSVAGAILSGLRKGGGKKRTSNVQRPTSNFELKDTE